ncbi:MAG: hydroxysqualene dehydroxylase HpnE [Woeseiaceae bacterium]
MNESNSNATVVIGAGWAGLAAAVKLTQQGHTVHVYESAKQVGGRARAVNFNDTLVDNGQHLLIGAYTECFDLFNTVGININIALKRLPFLLTVIDKVSNNTLLLSAPALPAPLHLLYALFTAKGFTFKDRIAAIKFGLYLKKHHYKFNKDISVTALFELTKQTPIIIKQLWEPLCLATMNTPIDTASANVFMNVFKDAFTQKRQDADLILATTDLSELFPHAAVKYIKMNGGQVYLSSRIEKIDIDNNQVSSIHVKSSNESINVKVENLIVAVAPQNTSKLFADIPELQTIKNNIDRFKYEPIITVYLQYPEGTQITQAMLGMSSTISQWVFDRGLICQQSGLISVVISACGQHTEMDNDILTQHVHNEIASLFTHQPELIDSLVIREKRATFACSVNVNDYRPTNKTDIKGLSLAGDYTDTQYPATLEGAVRSGIAASNLIIENKL